MVMSTKAKSYLEWIQLAVTSLLIPCLGYAVTWGGKIEQRIGENEAAIRLLKQENAFDKEDARDVVMTLKDNSRDYTAILQRLASLEAKLDTVLKQR